jgi:hypothetical protein
MTSRWVWVLFVIAICGTSVAQESRWASADDPVAKYMTDMERQWAEAGCTHSDIASKFLAEDFQGTAPDGSRYNKEQALKHDSSITERDCQLDDVKIRFFGDVAMAYGSERSTKVSKDGSSNLECLVWTDTWLKRNGKWQIIAVQDAVMKCK